MVGSPHDEDERTPEPPGSSDEGPEKTADELARERRKARKRAALGKDRPSTKSYTDQDRVLGALGVALSRGTSIYAIGMALAMPLSLISVVVTTAFLDPANFGRLGLLFTYAGMLTILYNLGSLRGTLRLIYGFSDDDDDGDGADDDEDEEDERQATVAGNEKRRILGSGLTLIVLVSGAGTVAIAAFAGPLADLLGNGITAYSVILAAICAATGSVWRLSLHIFRMDRRPVLFSVMNVVRPLVVVAFTVVALEAGLGLDGALEATAAGTIAAILIAIAFSWRNYHFAPRISDFVAIYQRGNRYIVLIITLTIASRLDIILLSNLASISDVGIYRFATRIAALPTYATGAFLMTWAPLKRSALLKAAMERKGGKPNLSSNLFTYYLILTLGLLLLFSFTAGTLVRLGPEDYAAAAGLIPVVTAALLMGATYHAVFRAVGIKPRRPWYTGLSILSMLLIAGLSVLLIPPLGAYGAGLATFLAMLIATLGAALRAIFGKEGFHFESRRILGTIAIALLCATPLLLSETDIWLETVAKVVGLVAYPALLMASGVLPRDRFRELLRIGRDTIPRLSRDRHMLPRVARLDADQLAVVTLVCRDGLSAEACAERLDSSTHVVQARLVRGLRTVASAGGPTAMDAEIGAHIIRTDLTTSERDSGAEALARRGVERFDLHLIAHAADVLRRASRSAWTRALNGAEPVPVALRERVATPS